MPKLFSIDVPIYVTAYIKAETAEEALNLAKAELCDRGIEFSNRYQGLDDNLCMDGRPYECLFENDEEIALSPAVTFSKMPAELGIAMIEEVEVEEEETTDGA